LNGRVDIRRIGGSTRHAREAIRAIDRYRNGTGFFTKFHKTRFTYRKPCLIEGVKLLEYEQS